MKRSALLIVAVLAVALIAPAGASAASKPGGHIYLSLKHVIRSGHLRMTLTGRSVTVLGSITPYLAQRVTVRVHRGGRLILKRVLKVRPSSSRKVGHFSIKVGSGVPGRLKIDAVHGADSLQRRVAARAARVSVYRGFVGFGSGGPFVRVIQHDLQRVGYPATSSGYFDARTSRASLAFNKVNGFARRKALGRRAVSMLLAGRGSYPVRYPGHGRHVEADLSRQVLAEIVGDRVHATYVVSSGKPSTPTVLGSFRFYRKQPGTNSHGMVYSSYFVGGYAIHGYSSVPNYAASHGCLRIPIPDAIPVYRWVHLGNRIDVYP
ncbi:MAG: hypothetical protein QOK31_1780 [Solirubrobacteraceae bacterium]|nr:hypothetical protein [Solirubrobacteraceae bacterium]